MGDLRLALRSLQRAPAFSAAAILVFAIGIGGSTAVFSVLRSVVLRPLGLPAPDQLVRLYERPSQADVRWPFSGPDFLDLQRESGAFAGVAGIRAERLTLTGVGTPQQIRAARVSASFLSTLRIPLAMGTGPAAGEDLAGGQRTAVLTDEFWRREFGGDRSVLGRTLTIDGRTYVVVGVLPEGFHFPLLRQAEVLLPLAMEGKERDFRGTYWVTIVARLKDGADLRAARSDLDAIGPAIHARSPEHTGWKIETQPLLDDLVGPTKPALDALFGAVLLALLIACANVAGLLLARGTSRQRELAIRAALGGGRAALVRHLLAEALVLGAIGGGLGMLIAPWALSALVSLAPVELPRMEEIRIDSVVLGFALLASIAAGLLAGLLPALQVTRPDLMEVLKNGAGGTQRARARAALVVGETALAFVLAAGAGLMIRTLSTLLEMPTGLAGVERVVVSDLELPKARYPSERTAALAQDLLSRLRTLPEVRTASLATSVPLDPRGRAEFGISIEGGDPFPPGQSPTSEILFATPGYLETMGVPLLRGRDLRWTDVPKSPHVVLVNEAFVKRFIPTGDPLGRRVADLLGPGLDPWEIAGVIGDVRTKGLDRAPAPLLIVPLLQYPVSTLRLSARATTGDPLRLFAPIRAEVTALDKDLPLSSPRTLSLVVNESVAARRFQMTLLSVFALVALALAALGIYGITAQSVAQRSREIGIRMALGADAVRVRRMVVGQSLRLCALGVAFGVVGALAATRVLESLVFQVSTTDPVTLGVTGATLVAAALLASWAPAARASRIDPAISMRAE
jgi:predicted permease